MPYVVERLHDDFLINGLVQQRIVELPRNDIGTTAHLVTQLTARYLVMAGQHVREQSANIHVPAAIIFCDLILSVQLRKFSCIGRGLPARYGQSVVVDLVVHGPFNVVLTGLRLLQPEQSNFRQVDTVPYAKEGRMEELIEKVFSLSSQ